MAESVYPAKCGVCRKALRSCAWRGGIAMLHAPILPRAYQKYEKGKGLKIWMCKGCQLQYLEEARAAQAPPEMVCSSETSPVSL